MKKKEKMLVKLQNELIEYDKKKFLIYQADQTVFNGDDFTRKAFSLQNISQ